MHPPGPRPEADASDTRDGPAPAPPLRTILVGTDLSYAGHSALKATDHLVPSQRGKVHVVHVVPLQDAWLPQRDDRTPGGDQAPGHESDVSRHRARLVQHVEDAKLDHLEPHLHLHVGRPFEAINATAKETGADLIVLGRHRPRRAFDGLLGSTAERVVRTSEIPSLLVNRAIEAPPRRIVVATDLSPHAKRVVQVAVAWASQWAAERGSQEAPTEHRVRVELVSIADFARAGYRPLGRAEALQRQKEAASEAAGDAVEVGARVASYPLAPEGIHKVTAELGTDLVFMGTHGYGPVLRNLFGSVTSEVIRTLPLPVVVVPLTENR